MGNQFRGLRDDINMEVFSAAFPRGLRSDFRAFISHLFRITTGNYPVPVGCEDSIPSQKLLGLKFSDNCSHIDVYEVLHLSIPLGLLQRP